jgi:class 3 adenylate cyclase
MPERVERRLTTIRAADVAEYSRLMRADEDGTLAALTACRAVVVGLIAAHRGRIANTAGDSVLAKFPSIADGLSCALAIQKAIKAHYEPLPGDRQMRFRIGVHLRDVMIKNGDLFGGAVNVAARLQGLAEPGRHLRLGGGARAYRNEAGSGLYRCRRPTGQEHRRAGACLPGNTFRVTPPRQVQSSGAPCGAASAG